MPPHLQPGRLDAHISSHWGEINPRVTSNRETQTWGFSHALEGELRRKVRCVGTYCKHCWFSGMKGWKEPRRVVWRWKRTLSDTITLCRGTTLSPPAPAWALTLTFIHAAMTKAQTRRACLNTNPLTGLISAAELKWSCHSWRSCFCVCVTLCLSDWCSLFYLLRSPQPLHWDWLI